MGLNAPFRLFASLDITSFISQPLTALFVLSTNFLAWCWCSFDAGSWQTWNSAGRTGRSRCRCPRTWRCLSSTSSATDSASSRPASAPATTPGFWPMSSLTEPSDTTWFRWEAVKYNNCIFIYFYISMVSFNIFPVHSNYFGLPRQAWTEINVLFGIKSSHTKLLILAPSHRCTDKGSLLHVLLPLFSENTLLTLKLPSQWNYIHPHCQKVWQILNSFTSVRGKASNSKIKFLQQYEKVTECQKFIKQGKFCYYSTTFSLKSSDVAFALEFHYY